MRHQIGPSDYKRTLHDAALSDSPLNRFVLVRVFQEPILSLSHIAGYYDIDTLMEKYINDSYISLKQCCNKYKLSDHYEM